MNVSTKECEMCECKPALNRDGTLPSRGYAMRLAREALTQRDGPAPGPKMVCRHLCKNDSMMPNGFVCTAHTVWGTAYENKMDQSPEARKRAGRVGGKINVESGHLQRISSLGGKTVANRPDHPNKVKVECPHCGKVGQKFVMARWHFDNCKFLKGQVLPVI